MEEAVAGIAREQALGSLFDKAKEMIGYMWNCNENVQKLEEEVERLKLMKRQVQQKIDSGKHKGDALIEGVDEWVKKAGLEISMAEEFLGEFLNANTTCFEIGMCGNWATLYHYGKRATEKMNRLKDHKSDGKDFVTLDNVYVKTRPLTQLDFYQTKNVEDLPTHKSALNAIIDDLKDETKQIIGIYGLGGVGKTTLAKEVAAKVKHLFADVAITTVSQTVKTEEIKKDIGNATQRIVVKGEKVLIILDDVWETLDLEELGIPINRANCRILLTSRNEDVCEKMNAQSKICVNSLPTAEAWILFKRVVGERVETDDLKPVAEEVAKECGGLPLLIQAVGNALKNKDIRFWNTALDRLKKGAPSEIDPDIRKAFTRLQLSYDCLESKEAKSCFLLCSMFPEDEDIFLEDLVRFGVGLGKFDDLDTIEDTRGRVQIAVNILKSSGLLLNGKPKKAFDDDEDYTKMHDVVRDMALLIASQDNNKFLVEARKGLKEWLPKDTSVRGYTGISLMYNDIIKLPDYKVNVPHLGIFIVSGNRPYGNRDLSMISDEFIRCMKNVKVLDFSWNNISSLPPSFQLLRKLRTLDLSFNASLHQISILGESKNLEILILNRTGITEIPKEIAQLVNLRVLEVNDCRLSRITQGVISALWRLEELRINLRWMSEGVNGCIVEIMSLSKLTYLELAVPSIDDIPAQGQGFNSEKLKEFVIQIGEYHEEVFFHARSGHCPGRHLVLSKVHLVIPLLKWLKKLIEVRRPHIYLCGIENLNNITPTLYDVGFNKLEHIDLKKCHNVSCLVDDGIRCDGKNEGKTIFKELKRLNLWCLDNLEVLWKCPDEYISLANLVTLIILYCDKLERVFPMSVAQRLVSLKKMSISYCSGLEEVIGGDGGGDDESGNVIVFPSLAKISITSLKRLKRFFNSAENRIIQYPSLVEADIHGCESMEIWGPGIHHTPILKTLVVKFCDEPIVLDGTNAINEAVEKSWSKRQEESWSKRQDDDDDDDDVDDDDDDDDDDDE